MKKKILKSIDQPAYLKSSSALYLSQTFWRILRNIMGKKSWTFFYKLSQKIKIRNKLQQLKEENLNLKDNLNYPNKIKEEKEIKKYSYYLERYKSSKAYGDYRFFLDETFYNLKNNINTILEIGISYGAGILSLKDYFHNSYLWGVDIDRNTFLKDKQIVTCEWVDQLKINSLRESAKKFNVKFDLIVDDGWHHPESQMNSMIAYLPYLNYGGLYIVEDIVDKDYYTQFQKIKKVLEGKNFKVEYKKFTAEDRVDILGFLIIYRKPQ